MEFIANYKETDTMQAFQLFLLYQWEKFAEENYYFHGNGD